MAMGYDPKTRTLVTNYVTSSSTDSIYKKPYPGQTNAELSPWGATVKADKTGTTSW